MGHLSRIDPLSACASALLELDNSQPPFLSSLHPLHPHPHTITSSCPKWPKSARESVRSTERPPASDSKWAKEETLRCGLSHSCLKKFSSRFSTTPASYRRCPPLKVSSASHHHRLSTSRPPSCSMTVRPLYMSSSLRAASTARSCRCSTETLGSSDQATWRLSTACYSSALIFFRL